MTEPKWPKCDCGMQAKVKWCYDDCDYAIAVLNTPGYTMTTLPRSATLKDIQFVSDRT